MKMTVNSMKCFSWSRLAIFTAAMAVLSSCGGGQSGMKLGDDEFTVVAVQSTAPSAGEAVQARNGLHFPPSLPWHSER